MELKSIYSPSVSNAQSETFVGKWKCNMQGLDTFFYYEFKKTGAYTYVGQWFGDATFKSGGQKLTWYAQDEKLKNSDGDSTISIVTTNELADKSKDVTYKYFRIK